MPKKGKRKKHSMRSLLVPSSSTPENIKTGNLSPTIATTGSSVYRKGTTVWNSSKLQSMQGNVLDLTAEDLMGDADPVQQSVNGGEQISGKRDREEMEDLIDIVDVDSFNDPINVDEFKQGTSVGSFKEPEREPQSKMEVSHPPRKRRKIEVVENDFSSHEIKDHSPAVRKDSTMETKDFLNIEKKILPFLPIQEDAYEQKTRFYRTRRSAEMTRNFLRDQAERIFHLFQILNGNKVKSNNAGLSLIVQKLYRSILSVASSETICPSILMPILCELICDACQKDNEKVIHSAIRILLHLYAESEGFRTALEVQSDEALVNLNDYRQQNSEDPTAENLEEEMMSSPPKEDESCFFPKPDGYDYFDVEISSTLLCKNGSQKELNHILLEEIVDISKVDVCLKPMKHPPLVTTGFEHSKSYDLIRILCNLLNWIYLAPHYDRLTLVTLEFLTLIANYSRTEKLNKLLILWEQGIIADLLKNSNWNIIAQTIHFFEPFVLKVPKFFSLLCQLSDKSIVTENLIHGISKFFNVVSPLQNPSPSPSDLIVLRKKILNLIRLIITQKDGIDFLLLRNKYKLYQDPLNPNEKRREVDDILTPGLIFALRKMIDALQIDNHPDRIFNIQQTIEILCVFGRNIDLKERAFSIRHDVFSIITYLNNQKNLPNSFPFNQHILQCLTTQG